ncbi:MAG: FKBP-type peptidyl-prolyl cis-trans isomerase [Planctomycetota bacterium]
MIRKISTLALIGLMALTVVAQDEKKDPPIPEDTKIIVTKTGLQYCILRKGEGTGHPGMGDSVTCHYRGWLKNGTVFDASYDKPGGAPATFTLGRVIPGWNEGLQLMSPGDMFKFTIPWKLAYGEKAQGPKIPAKSDLIFTVDLVSFKDAGANVPMFPVFRAYDKSIVTLQNGMRIKTAKAPKDPNRKIGQHDLIKLHYTFWNKDSAYCDSSRVNGADRLMSVTAAAFNKRLPFFASFIEQVHPGGVYHVEVPPEICFKGKAAGPMCPPNTTTVWTLEVGQVIPFDFDPALELHKTESGLEYEVIKKGSADGLQPSIANTVKAHYCGWTKDGHNFDSSYSRGTSSEFALARVVKGWQEGIPLMKEGAIYRFRIPWKDAYGAKGNPRAGIPAECDLIFYVELLEVK